MLTNTRLQPLDNGYSTKSYIIAVFSDRNITKPLQLQYRRKTPAPSSETIRKINKYTTVERISSNKFKKGNISPQRKQLTGKFQ